MLLFEVLFYTSLKTEEGQPISCHVVWLNPDDPDPDPPKRIVHDRWNYIPLAHPLPLTVRTLTKIAKASDPRTSSFAVHPDESGELTIWGLVDQGNRYHEFLHFNSESGQERPGLFQASIIAIGHLAAYIGFDRTAELRTNDLIVASYDVLRSGPIRDRLQPAISKYVADARHAVTADVFDARNHWTVSLEEDWIAALCRLLLRAQNYRHGGALLITPDESTTGLNIKYGLGYRRLPAALHRHAVHMINKTHASDEIHTDYLTPRKEKIPARLYLDEAVEGHNCNDARSELDGVIWFISLLSRVDGLVLLSPELEVRGFGVEITISEEPSKVFIATDAQGTERCLRQADYTHFGTRHRSMMRYCSQIEGSVGFVISQDGDVRVITKSGGRLVMWENVRLRQEDFTR